MGGLWETPISKLLMCKWLGKIPILSLSQTQSDGVRLPAFFRVKSATSKAAVAASTAKPAQL